jgi:two-component system, sensor histidine kinase
MLFTSAELARGALEAAPDAMVIIDEGGVIQFANRQVSALFGYPHEQVVGQSVEQLLPERFRARHVAHRQGYVGAMRVRPMGAGLALFGRRQDGSEFPVEISLSPLSDRDRRLVAAAIRDVTDRKRVEVEITVARETAEQARAIADRANLGKSRFLATASHDLRQPLQTLALLNGTLRRMVTEPDMAEALSHQEQAINAMSRLLNALLDISKLESGAVKPEPSDFKVAELFEELRLEFAGIAANKGLALQVETSEEFIYSDPSLVEQILKNLLSNAIKYTRAGLVRLRCLREKTQVRIDVQDTGIGIPPEQISCIFDEFYQVGVPTNTTRDGYGLGLSIVQRLVKLLNLHLNVTSEMGKGSVFSLLLPLGRTNSRPEAADVVRAPPRETQRGKPSVLLVEDDPSVRDATRMLLKVEGYRVNAVSSLGEALQIIQNEGTPDLLITDYHLRDGETGTQVIAAVRERTAVEVRAVLITGDTSTAIKAMAGDPRLRIASKPIKAEGLLAMLKGLLEA